VTPVPPAPPVRATALLVTYARCGDPSRVAEWEAWWDDVHVADVAAATGAGRVTRWVVAGAQPGAAAPGFTHVAMHEIADRPLADAVDGLAAALPRLWADGRMHPRHLLADVAALVGHGPHGSHPAPGPDLTGRILAAVLCNDPARLDEWDAWYDAQHVPDMLATGCFTAASRWRHLDPPRFGARHLTLYDISGIPTGEAVARSGAAMAPLVAAGRKPDWHGGTATTVLEPTGRHAPTGWTA
jgi:hypothetical protein